jgi:toxin FitB
VKYLLDTCLISELTKPNPNSGVANWLRGIPSDDLLLSAITIGEIRKGLAKMPASRRKQDLTTWLQTLLADYNARILPIDLAVAENWGILQGRAEVAGTPMATLDGLLAATAYTHNLTVVTRNVRDFAPANIPIYNPWLA